jgi:hypothetical protein
MRRGWLARTGNEFTLGEGGVSTYLRLTVHDLDDSDAHSLATDLAAAARAASRSEGR